MTVNEYYKLSMWMLFVQHALIDYSFPVLQCVRMVVLANAGNAKPADLPDDACALMNKAIDFVAHNIKPATDLVNTFIDHELMARLNVGLHIGAMKVEQPAAAPISIDIDAIGAVNG